MQNNCTFVDDNLKTCVLKNSDEEKSQFQIWEGARQDSVEVIFELGLGRWSNMMVRVC